MALEACGFIKEVTGSSTIKNLTYEIKGIKSIVIDAYDDLTFENVDVYGDVLLSDNNVAGYLVYADAGDYTVTFKGCESRVNYSDDAATHYGAHFIAYYPLGKNVKFVFQDCVISGTMELGRSAALFGNSSGGISDWGKNVAVDNLTIKNVIKSFNASYPAGIISWGNDAKKFESSLSSAIKYEDAGELITLSGDLNASISENKISVSSVPAGTSTIELYALPDISYVNEDSSSSTGYKRYMHRSWTIEIQSISSASLPVEFDVSNIYSCDESYDAIPSGTSHCSSFTEGDKVIYYIANTEPSYDHAYFGTADSDTEAFTPRENKVDRIKAYLLTAKNSAGEIVGVKSI